jgi:ribose-phosphate pyrophosphokinase
VSENFLVFSGKANYKLASAVSELLGQQIGDLDKEIFADDEPWYRIPGYATIRGKNVFIVQSTPTYAPTNYIELWALMDIIERQKPKKLVVIMPFMGFRRQERDKDGGEAMMAKMMAEITVSRGATDIVLCDPHAPVLLDYYKPAQTYVIDPNQLFAEALKGTDLSKCVVLTPDRGRTSTARKFADVLGVSLVRVIKKRPEHDLAESNCIQEDLHGKIVIFRDDEISTAGTLISTAKEIKKAGADEMIIMATHGVLSGGAIQKLKRMPSITKVFITDSIYLPWEKRLDKIQVLSLAPIIASLITQLNES